MEQIFKIARELTERQTHYSKLSWVQYTVGFDLGIEDAYKAMLEVIENKSYFETVKAQLKAPLSPEDKRRVELLYKAFEPFHLSDDINALKQKITQKTNELSMVLNTHRVQFEGQPISSVDLAQILAKDDDRERRKAAYMAKNQVNQALVDAGFLELIALRKDLAKRMGKESFVALQLEEDELEPSLFASWKDDVAAMRPQMKALRTAYAKKYLDDDTVMPWDESYITSKLAPPLKEKVDMTAYYSVLKNFFEKFGIDISTMNITYDVFSRANKSEWGYNFTIETGKDSRILANVKDRYNEYGVLLHETGHAVHSFMSNPEEILLNLGISGIISEGIANLFGGFLTDPLFYSDFFEASDVEAAFKDLKEWQKINSFRAIHRIFFDQQFYLNDLQSHDDIEALYWSLYKDLFGEAPFCENPPWAFLIHHTTHPIYLHNYFMGDVTCAMLKEVFAEQHGEDALKKDPKAFGDFLYENVIKPSGRRPYPELFEAISGKPFTLKYLMK